MWGLAQVDRLQNQPLGKATTPWHPEVGGPVTPGLPAWIQEGLSSPAREPESSHNAGPVFWPDKWQQAPDVDAALAKDLPDLVKGHAPYPKKGHPSDLGLGLLESMEAVVEAAILSSTHDLTE